MNNSDIFDRNIFKEEFKKINNNDNYNFFIDINNNLILREYRNINSIICGYMYKKNKYITPIKKIY